MNFTQKISTLVLVLATSGSAWSGETASFRPLSFEEAKEQAGMTGPVAEENAVLTQLMGENLDTLKAQLGDNYAGTWVEYDANGKAYQVIASLTPITISTTEKYDIKNIVVPNRLDALESIKAQIGRTQLTKPPESLIIYSVYTDYQKNKVVVRGKKENFESIKSTLAQEGFPLDLIDLEEQDSPLVF